MYGAFYMLAIVCCAVSFLLAIEATKERDKVAYYAAMLSGLLFFGIVFLMHEGWPT